MFTDVMNEGNIDDRNGGNTPDLEKSRLYVGWIYIFFFAGNILIHLIRLAVKQFKLTKAKLKGKYRLGRWNYNREKSFQKKMGEQLEINGVKRRSFIAGLCLRMCSAKKALD